MLNKTKKEEQKIPKQNKNISEKKSQKRDRRKNLNTLVHNLVNENIKKKLMHTPDQVLTLTRIILYEF